MQLLIVQLTLFPIYFLLQFERKPDLRCGYSRSRETRDEAFCSHFKARSFLTTNFATNPEFFGNLDATSTGVLPSLDLDGDGTPEATDVTLCIPNHVGYSSDINMAFNIGGALPDSSWIDAGEPAIASMHCYLDEFGPYEVGDVIVPTTNEFVIET